MEERVRETLEFSLGVLTKIVKSVCFKLKQCPVLSLRLLKPCSYFLNGIIVQRRQKYNSKKHSNGFVTDERLF